MIGKLTSVENGPERNVKLIITPTEVRSEISSPLGIYQPRSIDHYELSGLTGPRERLGDLDVCSRRPAPSPVLPNTFQIRYGIIARSA